MSYQVGIGDEVNSVSKVCVFFSIEMLSGFAQIRIRNRVNSLKNFRTIFRNYNGND